MALICFRLIQIYYTKEAVGIRLMANKKNESLPDAEIAACMDRAIRRSLQMPPKLHKDVRKPRHRKAKMGAAKPETELS